jgi:hypothetical protein
MHRDPQLSLMGSTELGEKLGFQPSLGSEGHAKVSVGLLIAPHRPNKLASLLSLPLQAADVHARTKEFGQRLGNDSHDRQHERVPTPNKCRTNAPMTVIVLSMSGATRTLAAIVELQKGHKLIW